MRFRLLTALWGAEFCDLFLRATARSLLAPGNLPDLSLHHEVGYSIFTTFADANRIAANPVFRALSAASRVELETFDPAEIDLANPASHWHVWRKGIEAAQERQESIIYIMPDVVYASGTLSDWAVAFEQGFRAVFTAAPEVVLETTLHELEDRPRPEGQFELSVNVRELNDLALKHIHPYHLCMLRDSRRWVVHPESVGYVARGAGFVQRVIGSHPLCFDPAYFSFNGPYVPLDHLDRIAFLPCTAISLEPLLKAMNLYYRSWKMTEDRLSSFGWWFNHYASDANDLESSHTYVFPLNGAWRSPAIIRAAAMGNFYRTQCLLARTIYRLWAKLGELGCRRAAELLATAHYAVRLRRKVFFRTPMTVLVPNDRAVERAGLFSADSNRSEREQSLLQSVKDQCFSGIYHFDRGQRIVTTASGELVKISKRVGRRKQTGRILAGPFELNGFSIYVTDFVVTGREKPSPRESREVNRRANQASTLDAQIRKSLLIHPSLIVQDNNYGPTPPLSRSNCNGLNVNVDQLQGLAAEIENLVKDYAIVEAVPTQRETQNDQEISRFSFPSLVTTARSLHFQRTYAAIALTLRPVRTHGIRAIGRFSEVLLAPIAARSIRILKPRIRELLLAGRRDDADAASRGKAYLWRSLGGDFVAQGHLELALYCRRKAVELRPHDLQLRQELMRELLVSAQTEEADASAGTNVDLWRRLGADFAAAKDAEQALYCRQRAVKSDPTNIQYRKELVRELLLLDRMEEASSEAQGLRHLWSELGDELPAQGYPDLARYCRSQATAAAATEEAELAKVPVAVEPVGTSCSGTQHVQFDEVRFYRGIQIKIGMLALHEILNGYVNSLGVRGASSTADNPDPLTYLEKYIAAHKAAFNPKSELDRLLDIEPNFAEAWLEKAYLAWEAGEIVATVEAALLATSAKPRCLRKGYNPHPHAEAAELIARGLEMVGLNDQAINSYRKSLVFDGDQPFLRVRLGQLLWRKGLADEASEEFNKGMTYSARLANLPRLPRYLDQLALNTYPN